MKRLIVLLLFFCVSCASTSTPYGSVSAPLKNPDAILEFSKKDRFVQAVHINFNTGGYLTFQTNITSNQAGKYLFAFQGIDRTRTVCQKQVVFLEAFTTQGFVMSCEILQRYSFTGIDVAVKAMDTGEKTQMLFRSTSISGFQGPME